MEELSVISVRIFGREYKIKGHADKSYIEKMAKYVDEKMRELSTNTSLPSSDRIAILAALNIADELFQERDREDDTLSHVDKRAARMIEVLDKGIPAEAGP